MDFELDQNQLQIDHMAQILEFKNGVVEQQKQEINGYVISLESHKDKLEDLKVENQGLEARIEELHTELEIARSRMKDMEGNNLKFELKSMTASRVTEEERGLESFIKYQDQEPVS